MEFAHCRFRIPLILCMHLLIVNAKAQIHKTDTTKLSIPGPANQDTTKFATFFVMRPHSLIAVDSWTGIFFDEYVMAKVYNNTRYIIKCAKTGKLTVWAGQTKEKSEIEIDAEPGKFYYIRMNIVHGPKHDLPQLTLLSEKEGLETFTSIQNGPVHVFDPDPLSFLYSFKKIESQYVLDVNKKTGFNEFLFAPPISTRHYFASADLGYVFGYVNKMSSQTFSELDMVQRLEDIDFSSNEDFENYVKKNLEKSAKKLKKSETLKEMLYEEGTSPADMTWFAYSVSNDARPDGIKLHEDTFLETRTYQACMYKKEIHGTKGRVFLVTFSERGLPEELHSKEEIFYKINLLVQSSEFGKVVR